MDDLIEEALVAAAAAYVRQGGGEVREGPSFTWVSTATRVPFYSGVIRTRLAEHDADRTIEAVTAEFEARGRLMGWWIMPPSRPADLAARLAAHGFAEWGSDLGMAGDLAGIPEAVPLPPDVTIERVRTLDGLEDWLRAFGAGFGVPERGMVRYRRLPLGAPPEQSRFRYFLARAGGIPVATALWFPAERAAVLDEIATVPAMRRRGIGTAVTHAALLDARLAGYRTAVLVASQAGTSVYRRLGFESHGRRHIFLRGDPYR